MDNQQNNNPQPTNQPDPNGLIDNQNKELAVNIIRRKLDSIYQQEPNAIAEQQEALSTSRRSKHQQFMYELTTSGKDLVQIQTQWHEYYQKLPDDQKQQVWQEFYASNKNATKVNNVSYAPPSVIDQQQLASHVHDRALSSLKSKRTRYSTQPARPPIKIKLTWKHHLQSALFGLSIGMLVVFIFLFGFFNEVIIAPFIQPSRHDVATPIILSNSSVAPSPTPEVIIPKINVEIPVDYSVNTTNENVIENDLEAGVVHYPTTSVPGQTGNAAYFGHSANNIFNPGKYKFAFVLLHDLVPGDVFYLTYNNTVYAYKVFSTTIVSPNDVSVLNPIPGHSSTATLITCDPPGTSINRLVVVGDQISPNPSGNTAPTPTITTASQVTQLPGNGPTLWHRFISTIYGKLISIIFVLGIIWIVWRWYKRELAA